MRRLRFIVITLLVVLMAGVVHAEEGSFVLGFVRGELEARKTEFEQVATPNKIQRRQLQALVRGLKALDKNRDGKLGAEAHTLRRVAKRLRRRFADDTRMRQLVMASAVLLADQTLMQIDELRALVGVPPGIGLTLKQQARVQRRLDKAHDKIFAARTELVESAAFDAAFKKAQSNPAERLLRFVDVTGDGYVAPIDALLVRDPDPDWVFGLAGPLGAGETAAFMLDLANVQVTSYGFQATGGWTDRVYLSTTQRMDIVLGVEIDLTASYFVGLQVEGGLDDATLLGEHVADGTNGASAHIRIFSAFGSPDTGRVATGTVNIASITDGGGGPDIVTGTATVDQSFGSKLTAELTLNFVLEVPSD